METLLEKTCKGVNLDLGENFAKSKNSLENFRKKLDELKSLEIDSELFIHEYFSSLRNEIDIDREKCKVMVDKHFLEIIEEVDKIEADCREMSKVKLNSEDKQEVAEKQEVAGSKRLQISKRLQKEFEVDFERLRGELEKLEINFKSWENIETTSNQRVSTLEVLIENMRNDLLLDKQYKYAAYLERLEHDIVYGRIYKKLEKNSFKKSGSYQWTMNDIKKLSETDGSSVYSPNFLFNGSNWNVGISNEDNLMGLFLLREDEEGEEDIDTTITFHLFNQADFEDNISFECDCKFNNNSEFEPVNCIEFEELFGGKYYDQENDSINVVVNIQYKDIQDED